MKTLIGVAIAIDSLFAVIFFAANDIPAFIVTASFAAYFIGMLIYVWRTE